MKVEIHIIQNFAPSCLNRDESNSPKDCFFGGVRRSRISSQCIKNAMRSQVFSSELKEENIGLRLSTLSQKIKFTLVLSGKNDEEAAIVSKNLIQILGFKLDSSGKTSVLLFIGNKEIEKLSNICIQYWDKLNLEKINNKDKEIRKIKKEGLALLDGQKAADIALFGRMMAEVPTGNIDAACQVAHAISTNRMNQEFDFFTAIDQGKEKDDPGAGMMGAIEFNSACYYRYSNIDLNQLLINLQDDQELAISVVSAFIRASIKAIPTGKQTSMAAQNPPSFVLVVVRDDTFWSLANAFEKPVRPINHNLEEKSIIELTKYWDWLKKTYDGSDIKKVTLISQFGDKEHLNSLHDSKVDSIKELITETLSTIKL
ncbi:MAG: type I-E CRISPR-associated protein Cas7/Cse4/CasC [Candidatus Helarchaeota archaeon]